ncbi:MAG: SemiSWEET transporter [Syntrophorhabdaceae bacterium]|nr:SemiSWEET transporter [Syntrophorhabdaceae bacterium]
MESKELIGYIAAFFTTFSMLPQFIRMIRLKEAKDVSIFMPSMMTIGVFLWLLYGIFLKEPPIIIANVVSLILSITVLIAKIRYR